jgi:LmbE family N-acetylglucosaminyl deacetylase
LKSELLAIVSHPDDETFGCGGTLAVHARNGFPVNVLSLTCSEEDRREELFRASSILGINDPVFFDQKKLKINDEQIERVTDVIVSVRPRVILTHLPFDYHREHRLAFEIVKEAVEWAAHTSSQESPWIVERLLLMEINTLIPTPHVLIDISNDFERKEKAIQSYSSQIEKFQWRYYENFNALKAELRGVQGGCRYAEAFIEESLTKNSPFFEKKTSSLLL